MKFIAVIGVLAIGLGLIGLYFFGDVFTNSRGDQGISEQQTIDGDKEVVNIHATVGSLIVEPSEDEDIHVSFGGNLSREAKERLALSVAVSDSEVFVELNYKRRMWLSWLPFINADQPQLIVSLPVDMVPHLAVELNVGEIEVNGVFVDKLNLVTNVGSVRVSETVSNQSEIEVNIGEIKVDHARGSWDLTSNVGDIGLTMDTWDASIDTKVNLGAVTVSIPEEPDSYHLDLKTGLGDVTLRNFNQSETAQSSQVVSQVGSSGPSLKANVDVGSIDVHVR